MNKTRAERRRENYQELRRQGYSSAEARKYRDVKVERRPVDIISRPTFLSTKTSRLNTYRRWSKRRNEFPESAMKRVRNYNRRVGKDPQNSFGYRAFYHWYVEQVNDEDVIMVTEARDT